MKSLTVFLCICIATQISAALSSYDQSDPSQGAVDSGGERNPYNENVEYGSTVSPFQDDVEDFNKNNEGTGGKYSERKSRYQASADQYNEGSAPIPISNNVCKEKNERYVVPGSCDKYIECLNGTVEEKQCPDGLRYNPNVKFNVYPCQYPADVPCLARSALQPAQPTADCPHQFGYFKTGDARNCSGFRNCVHGVGYDFTCPEGLAFSSANYRCEWPDEVEDCDVEAFLGFRCPEIPESKELGPPAGYRTYRSPNDCQIYFICINSKPRKLSCGGFSAFDEHTEACVAADEISSCSEELRSNAARSREAEKQRLLIQEAYEKLRYDPKQLYNYSPTTNVPEQFDILENETPRSY